MPMGDYFEGFLQEESRNLGLTLDEIRAWQPPLRKGRKESRTVARRSTQTQRRPLKENESARSAEND